MNLSGQSYGLLTVVAEAGKTTGARPEKLWLCMCLCGTNKTVRQNNLRSGHTKSCGCQAKEINRKIHTTHGMKHTSTYITWCQMKARCNSPTSTSYGNYGAKGITVCDRWRTSFQNFLADMGEKPDSTYSIERIDNAKGYFPENCRWATSSEQNRNYGRNVFIAYAGREQCLTDWASELGIGRATLRYRLKAGWTVDDAFNLPASMANSPATRNGDNDSMAYRAA